MFNLKPAALGAAFIGTTAIMTLTAASAQAISITVGSSLSLSGGAEINESEDTTSGFPTTTTVLFGQVEVDQATGSFVDVEQPPVITIADLELSFASVIDADSAEYSNPSVVPFINFGTQTIDGVTSALTFDLNPGTFVRNEFGFGELVLSDPGITGTFMFDGNIVGQGFLSASEVSFLTSDSGSYQLTLQVVPEPLTMLGAGAAIAFGGAFKRKLGKNNKKGSTKA
ncbi:MAG: PEP-CTERM sorting domain-containing protein [Crocosphaera sp.]